MSDVQFDELFLCLNIIIVFLVFIAGMFFWRTIRKKKD